MFEELSFTFYLIENYIQTNENIYFSQSANCMVCILQSENSFSWHFPLNLCHHSVKITTTVNQPRLKPISQIQMFGEDAEQYPRTHSFGGASKQPLGSLCSFKQQQG